MKQAIREFKINEGQVPNVMNIQNPVEQRRLHRRLDKLENEKKKRESSLSWSQRNFFMKQVFDQDKELRFVKAQQRPRYKPPDFESFKKQADNVLDYQADVLCDETLEEEIQEGGEQEVPASSSRPASPNQQKEAESTLPPIGQPISPEELPGGSNRRDMFGASTSFMKRATSPRDRPMFTRVRPFHDLSKPKLPHDNENKPEDSNGANDETQEQIVETDQKYDVAETKEEDQEVPSAATQKQKTKFPVLKIKALGLFAASMKKSIATSLEAAKSTLPLPDMLPNSGRESVSLPNSPVIRKKHPFKRQTSAKSLEGTPRRKMDEDVGTQQADNGKKKVAKTSAKTKAKSKDSRTRKKSVETPPSNENVETKTNEARDHLKSRENLKTRELIPREHPKTRENLKTRETLKTRDNESREVTPREKLKTREDVKPRDNLKTRDTLRTRENLKTRGGLKTAKGNIWQRVTSMPEPSVVRMNRDRNGDQAESLGIVDIEDDEEDEEFVRDKVIRRLVRTLPTDMLIKSVRREAEAGGLSTEDVRKRMLERAKYKMSRKVVLDPRFQRLHDSLADN